MALTSVYNRGWSCIRSVMLLVSANPLEQSEEAGEDRSATSEGEPRQRSSPNVIDAKLIVGGEWLNPLACHAKQTWW